MAALDQTLNNGWTDIGHIAGSFVIQIQQSVPALIYIGDTPPEASSPGVLLSSVDGDYPTEWLISNMSVSEKVYARSAEEGAETEIVVVSWGA